MKGGVGGHRMQIEEGKHVKCFLSHGKKCKLHMVGKGEQLQTLNQGGEKRLSCPMERVCWRGQTLKAGRPVRYTAVM